jgi:hypothetical protein
LLLCVAHSSSSGGRRNGSIGGSKLFIQRGNLGLKLYHGSSQRVRVSDRLQAQTSALGHPQQQHAYKVGVIIVLLLANVRQLAQEGQALPQAWSAGIAGVTCARQRPLSARTHTAEVAEVE